MTRTRVFVSSTCFDLAALREDLRNHLIQLGHEPILSEFHSFPVDPSKTAVANCASAVSANSDVFVLIIGGRRGSLDARSGKSVTNLEYREALDNRIPCFVFVNRAVMTLLAVWKKNPTADFTPIVDYPEVFKFIADIQTENPWLFSFEKTSEIKDVLGLQLSIMFRTLLLRDKLGQLDPLQLYQGESSESQRLARERPEYWEFLLTAELLRSKLSDVRRRYDKLQSGLVHVFARRIPGMEFMSWVSLKVNDLMSLVETMKAQLPRIHEAWGKPGEPGDVNAIHAAVTDFILSCSHFIDWEEDVRSARPPTAGEGLKAAMQGWTADLLKEVERLPDELLKPFANGAKPSGEIEIMLKFNAPDMTAFEREARMLEAAPETLLEF